MLFDICIIGGGAAGMMAAIAAKEANSGLKVAVFERLDRVGKKIALTGNGRCNITNKNISADNYYGKNPQFCIPFFGKFGVADTCRFFGRLGTPVIFENDKGYPRSLQAASVVDALRFRLSELKVKAFLNSKVTAIKGDGKNYSLTFTQENQTDTVCCRAVILTAGLLSGGAALGCDGEALRLLGEKITFKKPTPAIVQLKTDTEFVRQLKGIKVDAAVSLYRGEQLIKQDSGEVLFCDYGLSGPPVLQLSGHAREKDKIYLDLAPEFNFHELLGILEGRAENLASRKNEEFLSGLLNKRLGQVVIKRAGLALVDSVSADRKRLKAICNIIKCFPLTVCGNNGFIASQVSMGGIYTDQLDQSLMFKNLPGVFAAGEILDITGDCGGYNLQWAWTSGYCAAKGALEYLK